MMLVMVLFWAAVILGIVWLARGGFDGSRGGRRETPAEVLDRRFAEGEISADEYRERRQVIANSSRQARTTWLTGASRAATKGEEVAESTPLRCRGWASPTRAF